MTRICAVVLCLLPLVLSGCYVGWGHGGGGGHGSYGYHGYHGGP
jgi:hypothetical protein